MKPMFMDAVRIIEGTKKLMMKTNDEHEMNRNLFIERFRVLRTKIDHLSTEKGIKKIAITSAIAGEGKTLLSTNLSLHLASGGKKKVLLVETDLRKPNIANLMGIPPSPGLAEYLQNKNKLEDIVYFSKYEGLYIIPAGNTNNSNELLDNVKFKNLLDSVGDKFNFIIIDTPPVVPAADTMSIKNVIDGVIFVYRLNFTPYNFLIQAIDEMKGARILGVVLNDVRYSDMGKKYDKYHEYAYAYKDGSSAKKENIFIKSQ